ncbi:hypothetical protein CDAR_97351 [Caerostris darwini]|uniref:Uncharacterized protein n=1 Tax=Caerostris darwini TaxID=1538125 RepID=A0AAV4PPU7_9ARAC|nr:hypothetical protein CDAR_97351 [Caerostris darwini]
MSPSGLAEAQSQMTKKATAKQMTVRECIFVLMEICNNPVNGKSEISEVIFHSRRTFNGDVHDDGDHDDRDDGDHGDRDDGDHDDHGVHDDRDDDGHGGRDDDALLLGCPQHSKSRSATNICRISNDDGHDGDDHGDRDDHDDRGDRDGGRGDRDDGGHGDHGDHDDGGHDGHGGDVLLLACHQV